MEALENIQSLHEIKENIVTCVLCNTRIGYRWSTGRRRFCSNFSHSIDIILGSNSPTIFRQNFFFRKTNCSSQLHTRIKSSVWKKGSDGPNSFWPLDHHICCLNGTKIITGRCLSKIWSKFPASSCCLSPGHSSWRWWSKGNNNSYNMKLALDFRLRKIRLKKNF